MGSGAGLYDRYVRLEREVEQLRAEAAALKADMEYWRKLWESARRNSDEVVLRKIVEEVGW